MLFQPDLRFVLEAILQMLFHFYATLEEFGTLYDLGPYKSDLLCSVLGNSKEPCKAMFTDHIICFIRPLKHNKKPPMHMATSGFIQSWSECCKIR